MFFLFKAIIKVRNVKVHDIKVKYVMSHIIKFFPFFRFKLVLYISNFIIRILLASLSLKSFCLFLCHIWTIYVFLKTFKFGNIKLQYSKYTVTLYKFYFFPILLITSVGGLFVIQNMVFSKRKSLKLKR